MSFEELVCEVSDQPRKAGEIAQWVVASLEKPVAVADGHGPGKMGPSGQRWARQMEGSITWKGFQGGIVLFFINEETLNSHPHNKTTVQGPKTLDAPNSDRFSQLGLSVCAWSHLLSFKTQSEFRVERIRFSP